MGNAAITVEGLGKCYRLGMKEEIHDTFVGAMASWIRSPLQNFKNLKKLTAFNLNDESDDIIWALRDVSFEVKHGEVLGIIGHNGAGKSTLLKILSRITDPSTGSVAIDGRVASLLEVGTGFHQDLTGRENIFLNGTILGMTKKEIDRKFDEIIEFSGVEKFIDTPIKRYSSGMKVRLAFSVAAHLEPEILIIDEVLAVGDAAFQKKCLGKMQDVASQGRTVLFVSHQLEAVSSLCTKAILLCNGRIASIGKSDAIIQEYLATQEHFNYINIGDRIDRVGDGFIKCTNVSILDNSDNNTNTLVIGKKYNIEVSLQKSEKITDNTRMSITIGIYNNKNIPITSLSTNYFDNDFMFFKHDSISIRCTIDKLQLNVGSYYYDVYIESSGGMSDWVKNAGKFVVEAGDYYGYGRLPPSDKVFLMNQFWHKENERGQ